MVDQIDGKVECAGKSYSVTVKENWIIEIFAGKGCDAANTILTLNHSSVDDF